MVWLKRLTILLTLTLSLTGCFANLSQDGILSTVSSASAAALGTAVGGPITGVVAGVVAGVATDAATTDEETTADVLETIPEEDRADVLKHQKLYEAIEHIGVWLIAAGTFVIFILPLLVGWINSAIKGRRYKKEMVIVKENLFDHPDIKMEDLTRDKRKQ